MEGLHHFNVEWPSFTTQPSVGKPRHTTACGTRYTICADQTSPAGLPCGDRIVTSTWLVLAVIVAVCSHSFWFCDRSLLALGQTTHGTPQLRPAVSFLTPPHRRQVFVRDHLLAFRRTDRASRAMWRSSSVSSSHHVELFPRTMWRSSSVSSLPSADVAIQSESMTRRHYPRCVRQHVRSCSDLRLSHGGHGRVKTIIHRMEISARKQRPTHDHLRRHGLLHLAVAQGDLELCETLLSSTADPNSMTVDGDTALMIAAMYCRDQVAGLLIKAGADVDMKDKDGLTALELAGKWAEEGPPRDALITLLHDPGSILAADVAAPFEVLRFPPHPLTVFKKKGSLAMALSVARSHSPHHTWKEC